MSPRAGLDANVVLQAAIKIADQEGLEAVTIAALAKFLQVRPPSLYNHLESLQHLKSQLAVKGMDLLKQQITAARGDQRGTKAIMAIANGYRAFAMHHPGLYQATLRAPDANEAQLIERSTEIVEEMLQSLGPFALDEITSIHAVRGLRSILHGFVALEQQGGFKMAVPLEDSLRYVLEAYLTGLEAKKPS